MPPRVVDPQKEAKKERKAAPMDFQAELRAKIKQREEAAAKGSPHGPSPAPARPSKPPPPRTLQDELKAKMQSRRRAAAGEEEDGSDDEW